MSSIDERVVEMRFDNAQFEHGVKQTLSSLDKLKAGLKFDNALNGMNVLQNAFNGLKLGNIGRSVDQINNKFSALGIAGMEVVKRVTNAALNSVNRIATAIPNQIKQGGWSRALNLENAQFQLKGLGVTWDKVNNDIQYAVNGTAYGLDAAAKVAGQLAASGIQVSDSALTATKSVDDFSTSCMGMKSAELKSTNQLDEMSTALRSISGVAAMTNTSYEEIGQIFTRVAGQGRVFATDLNSISARGINAAATLANYLGTTETEVRDMVSKGLIDFKTFSDAMYDAYADQAVKANETFQGALSNTKSALSRIGADVADDLIPALTKILNSCRLLFNQVHKWIQPVLDSTGRLVAMVGDTLSPIIDTITAKVAKITGITGGPIEQIAGVIDKITEKLQGVRDKVLSALGIETQEEAEKASESVEKVATSLEHINEMAKQVIRGDFGNGQERVDALHAIGENYELIQNKVNELLGCSYRYEVQEDATADAINNTADATEDATKKAEELKEKRDSLVKGHMLNGLLNIGKTIAFVFKTIADAVKETASTLASDFGKIDKLPFAEGFDEFTGTIINSQKNMETFKQVVDDIVSGIGNLLEALGQVAGAFGKAFIETLQEINGQDPTKASGAFKDLTENLKLSKDGAEGLKDVFKLILSPLKVIVPLMQTLGTFLLNVASAAAKVNSKFLEFVGKSEILKSIQKIFEDIGDVIKKIIDRVKNSKGVQKLIDSFSKFKDILSQKVLDSVDKFAGKLSELSDIDIKPGSGLNKVIDFFSSAAEKLSTVFDTLSNIISGKLNFGDILAGIGEGITTGLSAAIGSIPVVGEALGSFGSGILEFFKNGNLKEQISEGSQSMLSGLFDSVHNSFEEAINKNGGIKSQIEGYAKTVGQSFADFGSTIKDNFQNVNWKDIGSNIKGGVGKVFDSIGSFILDPKVHKTIATLISTAKDVASIFTLFNAGKMFKSFADNGKTIAKSIGGFFTQLKTSVKDVTNLYKMKKKIGMFKEIGKAILMLVAAMAVVSIIKKYGDLEASVAVVGGLIAALSALLIGISKMKFDDAIKVYQFGKACESLGKAVLLIVASLAIVAHMDSALYQNGILRLIGLLGVYAIAMGLMFRLSGSGGANIKAAAFITFAVAVNLLLIPLKVLADMDADAYKDGLVRLIGILGTLTVAVGLMARLAGDGNFAGIGTFIGVSIAILVLVQALKSLSVLDTGMLVRNAVVLSVIFLALGRAFGLASGISVAGVVGFAVAIAAVTAALLLLQNGPHPEQVLPIAIGLSAVVLAVGASLKLMEDIKFGNAIGSAVAMGVALAAATAALMILQNGSKPEAYIPSAIGLGIALVAAASSLRILNGMKFGNAAGAAVSMGIALFAAAGALAILNNCPNPESVLPIATGLGIALVAVAVALRIMGGMGADIAGAVSAGASIGLAFDTIALCIEGLIALNGLFASIPGFESTMEKGLGLIKTILVGIADALGSAAGAFAGGFVKESSSRVSDSMDAIKSIVDTMTKMADSLSGTDFGSVLSNVKSLKKVVKELGRIKLPDKFADSDQVSEMQSQFEAIGDLIHYIINNLSDVTKDSISRIEVISDFMGDLKSFANAAAGINPSSGMWIQTNMEDLTGSLESIGDFCNKLDEISISDYDVEKVNNLAEVIKTLSSATVTGVGEGSFMGLKGLIAGVGTLKGTAEDMSAGAESLNTFCQTIARINITDSIADKVNQLASMMQTIESATSIGVGEGSFIGLKSFINGIGTLSGTGKDMADGIRQLQTFCDVVNGTTITSDTITKVTNLASMMTQLESATSIGVGEDWPGIGAFFTGVSSISGTASDMMDGVYALVSFAAIVGNSNIPENTYTNMQSIVRIMTMLNDVDIPESGGLKQFFTGTKDFSAYASDLSEFSSKFQGFAESISSLSGLDTALANMKNVESLLKYFSGDGISGVFSSDAYANVTSIVEGEMFSAGGPLMKFLSSVKDQIIPNINDIQSVNTTNLETLLGALKRITAMSSDFEGLENMDFAFFANDIKRLATALTDGISDINTENVDIFIQSIQKLSSVDLSGLSSVSDALNDFIENGINKFKEGMKNANVSSSITVFVNKIKTGFSASTFSSAAASASDAGKSVGSKFASGLGTRVATARNKSAAIIRACISKMSSMVGQVGPIGTRFGQMFATTLQSSAGIARSAGLAVGQNASHGLSMASSYAYTSGTHFTQNFANGINAGAPAAISAAKRLASSIKEIIGHTTPKKGPMKDDDVWGKHFAENFATGIDEASDEVVKSASNMANSVWSEVQKSNANGKKSVDDLAKDLVDKANDTLKKERKIRKVSSSEVTEYWKQLLSKVKSSGKGLLDENSNINDAIYKSAKDLVDNHKEQVDSYLTDESRFWKEVIKLTEEGTEGRENAIKEYNAALLSDPENYIKKQTLEVGEENVRQAEVWKAQMEAVAKDGDNVWDTTKQKLSEDFNKAITTDAGNQVQSYKDRIGEAADATRKFYQNAILYAKKNGATIATQEELMKSYGEAAEADADAQANNYVKKMGWMATNTRQFYISMREEAIKFGASQSAVSKLTEKAGNAMVNDLKTTVSMMQEQGKSAREIDKTLSLMMTSIDPAIMTEEMWDSANSVWHENHEKAQEQILSDAEKDLDKLGTYYDLSNTQQAVYWKGILKTMDKNSDAYSKAEDKFLAARNAAWKEYTDSVKSSLDKLNSDLSIGSEFKFNEQGFDILGNRQNELAAAEEYGRQVSEAIGRGILSDDVVSQLKESFSVKDTWAWQMINGYSDAQLEQLNNVTQEIIDRNKETAETLNQSIKPDFLYTDDEVKSISDSVQNVMQTMTDITKDPKWSESVAESMKTIAGYAAKTTKEEKTQDYVTLGNNLIDGTIRGITMRSPALAAACAAAIANAIAAAKAEAQVHSPSKKTTKIGSFMGEGFVLGMKDWLGSAGAMGKNLGDSALSGMNYMLAALASDINDDMDMSPTIRPVIDMSDVNASASAINSMLSADQAMRVAAGFDTMMASRQNGSGNVTNDNSVGSINVNIYPTSNQNANDISDAVIKKLNNEIIRKRKVYA